MSPTAALAWMAGRLHITGWVFVFLSTAACMAMTAQDGAGVGVLTVDILCVCIGNVWEEQLLWLVSLMCVHARLQRRGKRTSVQDLQNMHVQCCKFITFVP
jgi:hypothetical protein